MKLRRWGRDNRCLAYVDSAFAQLRKIHDIEERLANCGVEFELTQPVGVDTAEELLKAMDRADAVSQQLLLECPKPVLAVKPGEL